MSGHDDHDKLRQQVLQAMFHHANISISAPISPQLRNDYEIAADVLIRATKRPLDPKKIQKHVEAIQKRHNAKERDAALLPPIFVKTMNQNQQDQTSARTGKKSASNNNNNNNANEESDRVGRAAHHFDRVEREAQWANQVKKDTEEHVKSETERHIREEREKRIRLDALKQQVDEDHQKKESAKLEMRHFMDKKEAEGREIRQKEDDLDAQRRAKRASERVQNVEYLQSVRDRKNREQRQEHEQERAFMEKLKEQEDQEAIQEREKRIQKVSDMRTFLKTNVQLDEERRNDMIRNRQEEIRLAPQQGIFFDGAYRRSARVNAHTVKQQQVYDQFEAHTGADMRRTEHTERLIKRMEQSDGFLMDEQLRDINAESARNFDEKRRKQAEIRQGLQQQMTASPHFNSHHSGLIEDGAGKITVSPNEKNNKKSQQLQKGKKNHNHKKPQKNNNSNSNAVNLGGGVIPGLGDNEVAEELRRQREAVMRQELKEQALSQRKNRRNEVTGKI